MKCDALFNVSTTKKLTSDYCDISYFLKGEKMLKIDGVILSIHHANRIKMPFNTLNDKRFV